MSAKLPSFTTEQSIWLVTEVFENGDLLLKSFTQAHDNARKKKKWEELAIKANAKFGVGYFTDEKLKRRWETIQTQAKKHFDLEKQHRSGTGGGSQMREPPPFIRFVIEHFGHKAGFVGISGGIDSSNSFVSSNDLQENADCEHFQSETSDTFENSRQEQLEGTPTRAKKRKTDQSVSATSTLSDYREQLLQLEIRRSQLEIEKLEEERQMISEKRALIVLWHDLLKNLPQGSGASTCTCKTHFALDPSDL